MQKKVRKYALILVLPIEEISLPPELSRPPVSDFKKDGLSVTKFGRTNRNYCVDNKGVGLSNEAVPVARCPLPQ